MLLPALLVAPALWFGMSGPVAYNVTLLSAFALSGITMCVLVNKLTGHAGAGLVAGAIFAFSPFRFEHFHHLELQFVLWIPLTLYFLVRTVQGGRARDGLLVGACVTAQIFSSIYYGVFLVMFCAIGGLGWLTASLLNALRWWRLGGRPHPRHSHVARSWGWAQACCCRSHCRRAMRGHICVPVRIWAVCGV